MGALANEILRKQTDLQNREEIAKEAQAAEDKAKESDPSRESKDSATDMDKK